MTRPEVTILMPCLNESETLEVCIRKAKEGLSENQISGEVLVADNGSTDGSQHIAERCGARVVAVAQKGYGAALIAGIESAEGEYVIMGDADDSYDFRNIAPFVSKLKDGVDLVMGNRFKGGIEKNAMPFLHKYLGNPVLSWLGRLFFGINIRDFHCGLRGFNRDRMIQLGLRTTGMEFASEMVVRASLAGYSISEVPTTLSRDGRSRPPHLRTWRDGWRHLSFLLMYSPKWLFLYPGFFILGFGLLLSLLLFPGQIDVGGVGFDIHTFIVGCFSSVVSVQAIGFAVFARRFASSHKLMPPSAKQDKLTDFFTLERLLLISGLLFLIGLAGLLSCFTLWASSGFGPVEYNTMLRVLVLSMTLLAIGLQIAFMSFFSAITEIPTR